MNKKKTLLFGVSAFMACGAFIGCSPKKEDTSSLIIHGSNMGYGVEWMKGLVKDFTEETGIKVTLKTYDSAQGIATLMNEIEKGSDTDIIFTKITNYFKHVYEGKFLDISDVITTKDSKNNNTSIEERMDQAFIDYHKVKIGDEEKYYGVGWANGVFGIVRNKNMWTNVLGLTDEDMPYTTNELLALCQKVIDKNIKIGGYKVTPFINDYEAEYYTSLIPTWFMQYEGPTNMGYFNQALDPYYPEREISDNSDCASFYDRDGIKEMLKVLQSLIKDHKEYQHSLSAGYLSFKSLQDAFLKSENALFMPNGSWLESETTVEDYDVDFIPTPIISSIIDKVDTNGDAVFKTINDDATLSSVVKYIRNGKSGSKPAGVSDNDIAGIEETINFASYARNGLDHQMVIPSGTDKATEAKEFISFMFSDRGLNKYYKYSKGGMLGAKPSTGSYDPQGIELSDFRENFNGILNEGHLGAYDVYSKTKVFCYGGVSGFFNNGLVAKGIAAKDNVYYAMVDSNATADAIFNTNKTYLTQNWASIFAKIPH